MTAQRLSPSCACKRAVSQGLFRGTVSAKYSIFKERFYLLGAPLRLSVVGEYPPGWRRVFNFCYTIMSEYMKKKLILLLIMSGLLAGLLAMTSPNTTNLPVYLVVFGLIYLFFVLVITIIADLAYAKSTPRARFFGASILAFSPTIILAIASLSSLTFIDVILALGVPLAIVWYGLKGGFIK